MLIWCLHLRHDENWQKKQKCMGYWGWPWEQGAIWDVLTDPSQVDLLRGTCIRPSTGPYALNTIQGGADMPAIAELRRKSNKTNNFAVDPERIVLAYHHSDVSARYVLKRMITRGMVTSNQVWGACGLQFHIIPENW
jgi:hypothetical protein